MQTIIIGNDHKKASLYRWASVLALITIFYNIAEGAISVLFGMEDETLALFGFGLDSFVEVVSGIGIWHMILRLRNSTATDKFERQALRITGTSFYVLAVGLAATGVISLMQKHKPETTFWGIIVGTISIISMWALIYFKTKVGRELNSPAILADAECTRTCMYLSIILLISSIGYEFTHIGGLDSAGAILIAGFSVREGREALQKAKGNLVCGCQGKCR